MLKEAFVLCVLTNTERLAACLVFGTVEKGY